MNERSCYQEVVFFFSDMKHLVRVGVVVSGVATISSLQLFAGPAMVSAKTIARAQGVCRLMSGGAVAFQGHCVSQQKVNAGNTVLVIKLDNGSTYRFRGPSKEALQIETSSGLHNAQFRDGGNSNVFAWNDRGQAQRLAVRLETAHDPSPRYDNSSSTSTGSAIGAFAGALIGSLIQGHSGHGGGNQRQHAESTCLRAVSNQVGRSRDSLQIVGTESYKAGFSVRVKVPRAKAPWLCRVDGEGHVIQVEHTHPNGFL